jgi:CheY-like chemotaxis protein
VTVYSELGKGSSFKVHLPAQVEPAAEEPAAGGIVTLPRGNSELILVVDDEVAILDMTRQTLEAFGYRVLCAEDGAQAIAIFAQNRDSVRLVLTDMMMPIMDGPALIKALRRLAPEVTIVAASGLDANGHVARAAGNDVHHFIPKPYTAEHLLKTIREALDHQG